MGRLRHALALLALGLPLLAAPFAFGSASDAEIQGTLRTWHADTFSAASTVHAGVDTGVAGLVPLTEADAKVQGLAGRKVRVRGEHRGGAFAAGAGGVQPSDGATALAAVSGTKSVAVLLFNFSNNTSQPWTPSYVRGVVFDNANSVDEYYRDASYGQLGLTGDVYGWFTLGASNSGCQYTSWANEARSKATAAGVPLSSYQYVVFAFPSASSCGWSGLAYLPGTSSWINGAMSLRVVGHELGHNFGVHHASTLACTSGGVRTTFAGACTQSEYGDPFTLMGSASTRHHNNWHRAQLGWFADVQTVASTGTYVLTPAELTGTPRMVRVSRGDGTYLNLEFRQPSGIFDNFGSSDPAVNGVSIRIAPDIASRVQSKLVDANPATTTFADAALGVGQSVTDPLTGVSITTLSVGPAGANVRIQFAGGDIQAPTAPGSLQASPTSSTSVQLTWSAATDNVGVSGYRVYRNGSLVTSTPSLTYLDTGRQPQTTYSYEVRAYDAAGNVGAAAIASATTPGAGDNVAPSVPTGLKVDLRKGGRRAVLNWNAASDNVGVTGYHVFRNGVQVASPGGTGYNEQPGPGTFTYQVRARDAAGNVSALSAGVTVTTS